MNETISQNQMSANPIGEAQDKLAPLKGLATHYNNVPLLPKIAEKARIPVISDVLKAGEYGTLAQDAALEYDIRSAGELLKTVGCATIAGTASVAAVTAVEGLASAQIATGVLAPTGVATALTVATAGLGTYAGVNASCKTLVDSVTNTPIAQTAIDSIQHGLDSILPASIRKRTNGISFF
jgi:hypothetical protein